jgi:hypothetical protein
VIAPVAFDEPETLRSATSFVAERFIGNVTFWRVSEATDAPKFVRKSAFWLNWVIVPTPPLADAVSTEPLSPKLTLFEFENVRFVRFADVVPAEMLIGPEAVMTELAERPNVRLLLFAKVIAERFRLVALALTLMAVRLVATDAVIVEPFRPNEMPLLFENVIAERFCDVVPAEKFTDPCVEATVAVAVMTEPLSPKLTLFEFENVRFVRFADDAPADTLSAAEAVMTEFADRPNVRLLLFANVIAERFRLVALAETLIDPCVEATVTDAVMTEFDRPNDTLFEFENVRFVRFCDVAPAETLRAADAVMTEFADRPNVRLLLFAKVSAERFRLVALAETLIAVSDVATDAVIVEPLRPNEMPLLFENVIALRLFDVVPAEKFTCVGVAEIEAVSVEPFRPNETPLLFEKTRFERFADDPAAEMLTFVRSKPPFGHVTVKFAVCVATTASCPAEFEKASVTVEAVDDPTWSCAPS